MKPQSRSNLPFIFREIAKNELAMLCGVPPQDSPGLLLGRPAGDAPKRFTSLAVLIGGCPSLADFLALVKTQYLEQGYPFPRVITASGQDDDSSTLQELQEYLIVYDFTETGRQVMMALKRHKLNPVSDAELASVKFSELEEDFREGFLSAMHEARHYAEEFREPTFTEPREAVDFQLVLARKEGEPAGLAAILHHDLEYRLQALFVAPEHRGKRIGETLVSEFLERGQSEGAVFLSAMIPAGSNFFFYLGRFNFEPVLKFSVWTPPAPDFFKDV